MPEKVRSTIPRTFRIDQESADFLDALCPERRGQGSLVSRFVCEAKLRRQLLDGWRQTAKREEWDGSGVENL